MYSTDLQEMIKEQAGYRNNAYSGGGSEVAQAVIKHEMFEMQNEDIYDFFVENLGLKVGLNFGSAKEEDFDNVILEMMYIIKEKLNLIEDENSELGALWLTTKRGVYKNYSFSSLDEDIFRYELPADVVPISDLGDQGVLFVSATPIWKWNYEWIEPVSLLSRQLSEQDIEGLPLQYDALEYPTTYEISNESGEVLGYVDYKIKDNGKTVFIKNIHTTTKNVGYGKLIIDHLFNTIEDSSDIKGMSISGADYFWTSIGAFFENEPVRGGDPELFSLSRNDFFQ